MATEFICLLVMAHFLGSDDGLALNASAFESFYGGFIFTKEFSRLISIHFLTELVERI